MRTRRSEEVLSFLAEEEVVREQNQKKDIKSLSLVAHQVNVVT
jgi:hypothetical protein